MQDKHETAIAKDEMNLAEFPIALLSTRNLSEVKTLERSDTVVMDGITVNRHWIVTGSDKFGLPLAQDNDVLLALFALGKQKNFDSRTITFSRYDLLKMLNWPDGGKYYQRIKDSLNRLSDVKIHADNAFYDYEQGAYITIAFGIIDNYKLVTGAGRKGNMISSITLNEVLYKSIKAGFIKDFNFEQYLVLESSITKNLYRFLDKMRYNRRSYDFDLFDLAINHIGMSNYQYASKIKEKLTPANEELVDIGFLKSYQYRKRGEEERVIYVFANGRELPDAPAQQAEAVCSDMPEKLRKPLMPEVLPDTSLLDRLLAAGVSQGTALELILEFEEEQIICQLEALPYRPAKEPAAVLISAVRGSWALPSAYREAQTRKTKEIDEQLERASQEQQEKDAKARIDTYLANLSQQDLETLTEEARQMAKETAGPAAAFMYRDGIPEPVLLGFRSALVQDRLKEIDNRS